MLSSFGTLLRMTGMSPDAFAERENLPTADVYAMLQGEVMPDDDVHLETLMMEARRMLDRAMGVVELAHQQAADALAFPLVADDDDARARGFESLGQYEMVTGLAAVLSGLPFCYTRRVDDPTTW